MGGSEVVLLEEASLFKRTRPYHERRGRKLILLRRSLCSCPRASSVSRLCLLQVKSVIIIGSKA